MRSAELAYVKGGVVSTIHSPTVHVRAVRWRQTETETGRVVNGVSGGG
jgi:hypothetical protein